MNKQELVAKVAQDANLTKRQAEDAVNAFVNAVKSSLANGESVSLVGFGTFAVSERAARKGRNPQTGAEIQIPARKVPVFRAGKGLKEAL
ncbi:MAG TPA: HU family DNA-binding protein [Caldithrix abyssi]|uniref:HU family DNA-binding protein n=1 Tax=Caldithrix abyssi TaxID=187145 RepID=A0A7V5LJY5_CALAY|nr:HU family DNA-binding protein [Caldisericaceae bacterium]HHE55168.1 HU family DNA-binding protein [Caldithrix abyssi]